MAVAYANHNTYEAQGVDNVTIDIPVGYSSGDLLLAHITCDGNHYNEITTPSGWTKLGSVTSLASTSDVYYKIAAASESTPVVFGTYSTTESVTGAIYLVSGNRANITTVINASTANNGVSSQPLCPGISTSIDNTLLLFLVSQDEEGAHTPPTGYTERYDIGLTAGTGNCTSAGADVAFGTAGSTGTLFASSTVSEGWVAWSIAITPEEGDVVVSGAVQAQAAAVDGNPYRSDTVSVTVETAISVSGDAQAGAATVSSGVIVKPKIVAGTAISEEALIDGAVNLLALIVVSGTAQSGDAGISPTGSTKSNTASVTTTTSHVVSGAVQSQSASISSGVLDITITGAIAIAGTVQSGAASITSSAEYSPESLTVYVTLAYPLQSDPAAGALTVTGYPPISSLTTPTGLSVAPPAGRLVVTGYAPIFGTAEIKTFTPASGRLVATGYAPTVSLSAILRPKPTAGSLVLTGYAPAILTSYTATWANKPDQASIWTDV